MNIKDGRRNKLYNFIVNTYGISKESILSIIDVRLENILSKEIRNKLSSNHFECMVVSQVAKFIKDGTLTTSISLYRNPSSFESLVKDCMREEIRKIVQENYEISLKIKE